MGTACCLTCPAAQHLMYCPGSFQAALELLQVKVASLFTDRALGSMEVLGNGSTHTSMFA